MNVAVTAEHIAAAAAHRAAHGPDDGPACPIARALSAAGCRRPRVGPTSLYHEAQDGSATWIATSKAVEELVFKLMRGDPINPCLLALEGGRLWTYNEYAQLAESMEDAPPVRSGTRRKRDTSRKETTP